MASSSTTNIYHAIFLSLSQGSEQNWVNARLRLDGNISAQILDLLTRKEQPNAAVFTFVE